MFKVLMFPISIYPVCLKSYYTQPNQFHLYKNPYSFFSFQFYSTFYILLGLFTLYRVKNFVTAKNFGEYLLNSQFSILRF